MTGSPESVKKISRAVNGYLSAGLLPDDDTLNFIKSAYGISGPDQVASLIGSGDDGGAVIDMVSYPPDSFRESVEHLIPAGGFCTGEIRTIENDSIDMPGAIFIQYEGRQIFLPDDDSRRCIHRFIQRLNLEIPFNFFSDTGSSTGNYDFYKIRSLLRKKKFVANDEKSLFINDLVNRYRPVEKKFNTSHQAAGTGRSSPSPYGSGPFMQQNYHDQPDLITLVNIAVEMFSSPQNRPFDILSEKKYYYQNAINESEEFSRLLKTCSMEFIMSKRIRPPLVSIDEAHYMAAVIDILTSVVYGMTIPSVINVFENFE